MNGEQVFGIHRRDIFHEISRHFQKRGNILRNFYFIIGFPQATIGYFPNRKFPQLPEKNYHSLLFNKIFFCNTAMTTIYPDLPKDPCKSIQPLQEK